MTQADRRKLAWGNRTYVMGVINVTPDSFSGDGLLARNPAEIVEHTLARAQSFVAAGAAILDVGGESTRPNATPVPLSEELARVIPVIVRLQQWRATLAEPPLISIDTYKPAVAEAALAAGADIINDISGLRDATMRHIAAGSGALTVIMHMRGTPATMQSLATYTDVIAEVGAELEQSIAQAIADGVDPSNIIIDPGIGFAKTGAHNLVLLRHLPALKMRLHNMPLLVGVSRKAFIGKLLDNRPANERIYGTAAAVALSIAGGADIVRVHDVVEMAQVVRVADAIVRP